MGALLFAVGLGLFCLWKFLTQKAKTMSAWPGVPGRVISSELERVQDTDKEWQEEARVVYEYAVGGTTLRGGRIALGGSGQQGARGAVARYASGSAVEVYYDPSKPSSAVLERQLSANSIVLPIVASAFVLAGALLIVVN